MLPWIALALAADPRPPVPIERVLWSRPIAFAEPVRYDHTAAPRDVSDGWLFVVRVDPDPMRPREIGVPLPMIGSTVAVRLHWGAPDGCAVLWAPGKRDLAVEPVYFGSDALPEVVDADAAAAELARARVAGIRPLPPSKRGEQHATLAVADLGALARAAADELARCAP